MQRIEQIKQSMKKITRWPWVYSVDSDTKIAATLYSEAYDDGEIDIAVFEEWTEPSFVEQMTANALFISNAPGNMAWLIGEYEAAKKSINELGKLIKTKDWAVDKLGKRCSELEKANTDTHEKYIEREIAFTSQIADLQSKLEAEQEKTCEHKNTVFGELVGLTEFELCIDCGISRSDESDWMHNEHACLNIARVVRKANKDS